VPFFLGQILYSLTTLVSCGVLVGAFDSLLDRNLEIPQHIG
jgi:hypothetical protein